MDNICLNAKQAITSIVYFDVFVMWREKKITTKHGILITWNYSLVKTQQLIREKVIMRSLHFLITFLIVSPSVYLECSYLYSCIVKTTHNNCIFINMIAHMAAFVSTIFPIYIQPQSGAWFEYPELRKCYGQQYWSGVYSCIFANRSCDYMREFFTWCKWMHLFQPGISINTHEIVELTLLLWVEVVLKFLKHYYIF